MELLTEKSFEIFQSLISLKEGTLADAYVCFLHAILIDLGFLPKDILEETIGTMWPKDVGAGVVKIRYYHKTMPNHLCFVTFLPLCQLLVIDGVIDNSSAKHNVHCEIKMNNFTKKDFQIPLQPHLPTSFCKLKNLVIQFKDQFCFPLLSSLAHVSGSRPLYGILTLVEDTQVKLLKLLPIESVVSLTSTNKYFRELGKSQFLWEYFLNRDFKKITSSPCEQVSTSCVDQIDYKEKYKKMYVKQASSLKQILHYPLYSQYIIPHPQFLPLPPPSIWNEDEEMYEYFPHLRNPNALFRPFDLFPPHHPFNHRYI